MYDRDVARSFGQRSDVIKGLKIKIQKYFF